MVTNQAVPELITLLRHSNPTIAEQAANVAYEMSRKPAQRAGLTENEEFATALVAEIKENRHKL